MFHISFIEIVIDGEGTDKERGGFSIGPENGVVCMRILPWHKRHKDFRVIFVVTGGGRSERERDNRAQAERCVRR